MDKAICVLIGAIIAILLILYIVDYTSRITYTHSHYDPAHMTHLYNYTNQTRTT